MEKDNFCNHDLSFQAFESNHDDGVPLEHLVTAVSGVSIQVSSNSGVKILIASYESALPEDVRSAII